MAGRAGVLVWTGTLVAFLAILLSRYYDYRQVLVFCPALKNSLDKVSAWFEEDDVSTYRDVTDTGAKAPSHHNTDSLITTAELSEFDGKTKNKGIRLSILGQVFDVSRGERHYGPGGPYHHFAGRDATKSFVTGEFAPDQLSDDVSDLTFDEMLELDNWLKFYQKDYTYKGKLIGRYYDDQGQPTEALRKAEQAIAEGQRQKDRKDQEHDRFPGCNSEWDKDKGGRVWCSTRSGGVTRDWVGVPRQLFDPKSGEKRCVCVHPMEVDNPNLREFPGCPPKQPSCPLQEDDPN